MNSDQCQPRVIISRVVDLATERNGTKDNIAVKLGEPGPFTELAEAFSRDPNPGERKQEVAIKDGPYCTYLAVASYHCALIPSLLSKGSGTCPPAQYA